MVFGLRLITLTAFVAIAAISLLAAFDRPRSGRPSVTFVPESAAANRDFVVTAAPPGSPLRVGDHFEIDDPRTLAAVSYRALAVGATLEVRRTLPLPVKDVGIPVVPTAPLGWYVVVPIEALFLAVAFVIGARGRASGSLSLAWLLALLVLLVNPVTPAWPGWLILAFGILSGEIVAAAFCCASDFATRFAGDPQAGWARRARRVSLAIAAVSIAINTVLSIDGYLEPTTPPQFGAAIFAAFVAQTLCFLGALGIAFAQAPGPERQRVAWVGASLGAGIIGFTASILLGAANVPEPLRNYPLVLMIAMPLGCAYAILRYRLLDIAFVVNRATVFGVTSLLVLAALALVDSGLQTLLGSWLLRTGMIVQLGLALAIGIATRPIHAWVDGVVDDVFFRQRHEAERALRQYARDVAYIDDAGVVLERTVDTIARTVDLRCAILLLTADGLHEVAHSERGTAPAAVDRNDVAVVRVLASREPVDLHDLGTALAGDFAFGMFARNRLVGVLTCGRDTGATYAPDEIDAIAGVAQACGIALDLLRIEGLERELAALRGAPGRGTALRSM